MGPPEHFQRTDESNDSQFYSFPRLVVHIDQQAIEAVSRLFLDLIPSGAVVLDLMSSWRSHWPQGHPKNRMIGLGLNAEEMADNPELDEYIIHDLNREPTLPFEDEAFDAVVLTVSAQYMTRPVETFQQVNRVMKTGGVCIVTFSNRMFPTKAVRIWRESTDQGRMGLVTSYMESVGNFGEIRSGFVNPDNSPPADPIFTVVGRKGEIPLA
jgi:SAM-dependent methyltransferase